MQASGEALSQALAEPTGHDHDTHIRSYLEFCQLHNYPITPTETTFARYIVFVAHYDGVAPDSLDTYLSGISFRLRPYFPDVEKVRKSRFIRNVIKGTKKMIENPVRRKQPITFSQLEDVAGIYNNESNSYDDRLFLALFVTGFFGLMRVGELTDPNDPLLINRRKTIRRDSLVLTDDSASFILPASKTGKTFTKKRVSVQSNGSTSDPVAAITTYVRLRDQQFQDSLWLWVTSDGVPPSRRWFLSRFHIHFETHREGHSMRAGGATLLAQKVRPRNLGNVMKVSCPNAFRVGLAEVDPKRKGLSLPQGSNLLK
ncbi:hypothetical protein AGABI2DRAFT_179719 [Agaricus bisporus var. bisporus H97]|uniref:hypothetical protein n=1 Tax=Agaricus bisporus var. bisporus (strain H97 / ATCC MYA-4626 / FGSC 10389) TaxID=936046 RepID=UPI00029F76CD|nr:hypothetical protein AGABI2DRAFT_179719 [Agaricus bisporus var. bisporus H97]EKV45195.1 hypothetical protein AGABI2DRAFT_179719 [Agaricus bisporus var. bisporus H97]